MALTQVPKLASMDVLSFWAAICFIKVGHVGSLFQWTGGLFSLCHFDM